VRISTLVPVTLYAAYGSNLDPHRMAERAPASPAFGTGWLRGWRLTFAGEELGWGGAMCTVVEDERESVFVMLYDVPPADEQTLDVWEDLDLGLWRKIRVRVQSMNGEALAWLYVLDAYEGGLPSAEHVSLIAGAAERAGAPADYVAQLYSHPTQVIPND
jgi:gamma-glutamylcyclotransferase (GGCT)/AIG2-like uncharacterized protein YtfP